MLGLDPTFNPKYVKRYANLNQIIKKAVEDFRQEVRDGEYPDYEHAYH
jgi:3-methyl-2-oxobutanoate hydroxymethyltransferase